MSNFEAFLRPNTNKTIVVYVHIEYSTYQFSEESLLYRKKRGPEMVKIWLTYASSSLYKFMIMV